ncbi:MAG: M14 family metallopeptidase [Patescibacteria group bacterium]
MMFSKRRALLALISVVVLGIGIFIAVRASMRTAPNLPEEIETNREEVIGTSIQGRKIEAFTFGKGDTKLLFVGGIHGGYEWNSVLLAYQFLDYLKANPSAVPESVAVTVIPSLNPDGVYKVIGKEGRFAIADVPKGVDQSPGRFNARGVDLNRNFDCKWSPDAVWRNKPVGAGFAPFSEPEAFAFKNFALEMQPDAVVFWHSQAGAVYASKCEGEFSKEVLAIMNVYARAAGYRAETSFDAYEVVGDADGWLASIGIPSVSVELTTHEAVEWEKNIAGIKALFTYFAGKGNAVK